MNSHQERFSLNRAQSLWVILLCLGVLACTLFQIARVANPSIQYSLLQTAINEHKSPSIVSRWHFASAHSNLFYLVDASQRRFAIQEGLTLLVARSATATLGLLLPLLALFSGLALVRSTPRRFNDDSPASTRQSLLWMGILSIAVPLMIGGFLVLETHILEASFDWSQWSRLLVWLFCIGIVFSSFLCVGLGISRRVKKAKTVVWIFLSLFVALFILQASREPLMRLDGSQLPNVPDLPTEVRMSLFRPSGQPQVIPEREQMIAEYLASVDAYSESVHALVAHRYAFERWWHVVSPQLLLSDISNQLLQTRFANVVDVAFSAQVARMGPSLAASLRCIWPEMAWLCLIMGCAAWAAVRVRGRQ